ncbi:MAG: hypothetical protein M8872_12345 [marine benthic group bacterium]|nr:hypothetical protein [Gemmatimonadota bacterium]
MTTFQKLKHEARRAEQRSDWRKAINLYREALRLGESRGGPDELGLFNRIGDLHIRLGEIPQAVECYENAADRYAENQLPTSAVALCNKILRVAPDRTDMFRRLALLHSATGLVVEARSSLIQYVDRMQAAGDLEAALEGVQQFADAAGDDDVRLAIAELLSERGHRAQAVAQIRLAAASARRRGDDVSALEERLRQLDEAVELMPDTDSELASPEPESETEVDTEMPPIRLDERIAAAFDSNAGRPEGFAPGRAELPAEDLPGPEDPVAIELEEFRSGIAAALEVGGPSLQYDIGVAFQAMGLRAAALEALGATLSDPSYARRASERIASLLGAAPAEPPTVEPDAGPNPESGSDNGSIPSSEAQLAEHAPDTPTASTPEAEPEPTASTPEAEPEPTHEPELTREPDPEEKLEPNLQALFFRARLAQYQIRKAEDSGRTDHRSHLDLGAAYAEMGLAVEAVRELMAAAAGSGHVASRAFSMLLGIARDEKTTPEVALGILERMLADSPSDSILEALDELQARWGDAHPLSSRIAELRVPPVPGSDPAHYREPAETTPAPDSDTSDPTDIDEAPAEGPTLQESPASLEALDAMLDQLEGDAFGIVVPVGHLPVDAAAELCAEADDLLEKGRAEDAAARLFRALELLEDAREVREAVRVVDRLLALRPDDVVLHHQRAEFALGLNDRSLLVESYMALASSLRRQEAPDSARTVYARILEIDPEHAGASEALQSLAERSFGPPRDVVDLGGPAGPEVTGEVTVETPEAPTDFDALLGDLREPGIEGAVLEGDAQAHFELGIAFKQMEMWDEAIAELEQAVAGREDPRPVWEAMAECFTRLGDADRALEILLEAESHPANLAGVSPAIGYRIALLLEERGDRPGAIERLQRVVEAEPGFLDAAGRLSALSG